MWQSDEAFCSCRKVSLWQSIKGGELECISGRQSAPHARVPLSFLWVISITHHKPADWSQQCPSQGTAGGGRGGEGAGCSWGSKPIKYHICIKMPSLGSPQRGCYFRDAYLKAVEVWALHAGIAPYTISIIYRPHLYFTGLPGWGWGGCSSHHHCLNNMCPNDVTDLRGLMGVGWEVR